MPWNGNGIFTRGFSWVNDAANNVPITASRMDADTNDIVSSGLGNCLTRDGQGTATANLPMNGFKHTNCGPGVANTDYATMAQISGFAPLASPTFTGTPNAPTAPAGNNSTQIATTAFVGTALGSYLPLSGGTLTGPLTANSSIFLKSTLFFTAASGIIQFNGTQLIYDDNNGDIQYRTGIGPYAFFSMLNNGDFHANNGSVIAGSNVTASGVFIAGTVQQPTIFVQAGTPTARNVGDLWFF